MTTTIGTTIIIVQSIPLFWAPFSVVELISSIIWDFVLASFSGSSWSIDFVLFDKGLPRADVAKRPTITSRQILTNSISLKFEVWILNFKIQIILKLCDLMKKIKKVFWCARAGNGNYFFFRETKKWWFLLIIFMSLIADGPDFLHWEEKQRVSKWKWRSSICSLSSSRWRLSWIWLRWTIDTCNDFQSSSENSFLENQGPLGQRSKNHKNFSEPAQYTGFWQSRFDDFCPRCWVSSSSSLKYDVKVNFFKKSRN